MVARKLKHDGWLMVADGAKAMIFRNEGDEKYPNLQMFWERKQDNPPTREQGTDRQGRLKDNALHHRSSVDETDWHRQKEDHFAAEIADKLYQYAHQDSFAELIVVAPPRTLAALRKQFHREVSERVIAEIDKDLTNHPVHEIEKNILSD
jgi:protein required for attachment to host cells